MGICALKTECLSGTRSFGLAIGRSRRGNGCVCVRLELIGASETPFADSSGSVMEQFARKSTRYKDAGDAGVCLCTGLLVWRNLKKNSKTSVWWVAGSKAVNILEIEFVQNSKLRRLKNLGLGFYLQNISNNQFKIVLPFNKTNATDS